MKQSAAAGARRLALRRRACACRRKRADAMSAEQREPLGEDRLSFKWKFVTADRRTEVTPQEFAAAAVYADTLYIGSASGWFYALRASQRPRALAQAARLGRVRAARSIAACSTSAPTTAS